MMEGLGRYIKHAKEVGNIKGLQLSENGQALTHQQFVYDTMMQGIAMIKEDLAYKHILYVNYFYIYIYIYMRENGEKIMPTILKTIQFNKLL